MSDIFISYSNVDRERVEPLIEHLKGTGWTVFSDVEVPTGGRWRTVIQKEVYGAQAIVVVWSKSSVLSQWVIEEAEVGRKRDLLFPVRLDNVELPFGFRHVQAINLWEKSGYSRLVHDLAQKLGKPPDGRSTAPVFLPAARRTFLWLGPLVLVVFVVLATILDLMYPEYDYTISKDAHTFHGSLLKRAHGIWALVADGPGAPATPVFFREISRDGQYIYLRQIRPRDDDGVETEVAISTSGSNTFKIRAHSGAPWESGELTKR